MTADPACEYDEDAPWAEGWSPDLMLVPAVLAAGNRPIATITNTQDRCWLIAGLRAEGLTAEDIRDRLHCSLRLVRSLIALDMTTVCRMYHTEAKAFAEELRLTQHELGVRTQELANVAAEAGRVREQRDRMIDAAMTGGQIKLCHRNHVMDKYNTYTRPDGREECRTCRNEAVQRHRAGNAGAISISSRDGNGTRLASEDGPVLAHEALPLPVAAPGTVRCDVRSGVRPADTPRNDAVGEQVGKLQQH